MPNDKNDRRRDAPQVEDEDRREPFPRAQHEAGRGDLREGDEDSERSGAEHARSAGGEKGEAYEGWSRDELYEKARELGLEGRSKWTKRELLEKLRKC